MFAHNPLHGSGQAGFPHPALALAPDGTFHFLLLQRRRPGGRNLRGRIPGPHVPLSTLRRRPCERLRKIRGRCGSL